MKIFAIPILRNHFTYYTYYCHGKPKRVTYLSKITDLATKKWDQLYHADKNSWKGKLYSTGLQLLDKIDHQEYFLKSIPLEEDVEKDIPLNGNVDMKNNIQLNEKKVNYETDDRNYVPLLYPSKVVNSEQIMTTLEQMLVQRLPYHRKYMIYSALCVPLTSTFTLIPVLPNIPLFYNLFRLYSHYKAFKGAQHLQFIIKDKRLTPMDSHILDQIYNGIDLNNYGILDENRIHKMAHELNVLGLDVDVKRARLQILEKIKSEPQEKQVEVDNNNKQKTEKR
ncbi:mitochondrial K+-H+ exchange-related-domain-containing protein [Gigaspora rosea]|uniref:Mitochondrial K+-H+ exchange-related-domain-containing protein n=1 Tax=Gigaspora rosea TaxID=44941 RepID=A0A397UDX6_9GLOM|nr:mitochondrial K+-H+ exchange-related-domain-containing protein [Gigaspora rosea]